MSLVEVLTFSAQRAGLRFLEGCKSLVYVRVQEVVLYFVEQLMLLLDILVDL